MRISLRKRRRRRLPSSSLLVLVAAALLITKPARRVTRASAAGASAVAAADDAQQQQQGAEEGGGEGKECLYSDGDGNGTCAVLATKSHARPEDDELEEDAGADADANTDADNDGCSLDPDAVDALQPGDLNAMFQRIIDPGEVDVAKYEPVVLSRPGARSEDAEEGEAKDDPWVVLFDKFLTPRECDRLVWHGRRAGYERSKMGTGRARPDGTHDEAVSASRTSSVAWCKGACRDDPVVGGIVDRIADVSGVPRENSESLQLLEYSVGQYYVGHNDYIKYHAKRPCGVRILTFFLYLNDVESGGGTRFLNLNLTVHPKKGRALLWPSVLDAEPNEKDGRTDHMALAVEEGVKYGANAWLHMRDFQTPLLNNCHK